MYSTARDFYSFWNDACRVTSQMEAAGAAFDVAQCNLAASSAATTVETLTSTWFQAAPGVNPESPAQLATYLYATRGFPVPPVSGTLKAVKRTKPGEKPTSEAALDWLVRNAKNPKNQATLRTLMELRKTTKLHQFLTKLPEFTHEGMLYASFGPDTGTGRLSSRNPNLQNIPGAKNDPFGIRRCFTAPADHKLLVADYCVSPDTLILTSDLRWVRADAVSAGDEVIGFDEEGQGSSGRKFRRTKVTGTQVVTKPGVIILCSGDRQLDCSANHMWLVRRGKHPFRWTRADKLVPGDQLAFMVDPWGEDKSREGGYLAGILDGEGWCSGTKVGFAQKPGVVLDRALAAAEKLGLPGSLAGRPADAVQSFEFSGNRTAMRALGVVRPQRLLDKSASLWEGRRVWSHSTPVVTVLGVTSRGEQNYIAIETDSKTFIADGFLSHNCALEPRILAHWLIALFDDHTLADAIASGDLYSAVACRTWPDKLKGIEPREVKEHPNPEVRKLRDFAKIIVLSSNYGKSVGGLALQLGVEAAVAGQMLGDYFRAYPGIQRFQGWAYDQLRSNGVRTLLGRTRDVAVGHTEYEVAKATRVATNTIIQGSAADVVFAAMVKQDRIRNHVGTLQLQVHDELVIRIPAHQYGKFSNRIPEVIHAMEHPFDVELKVPLKVEWKLCNSWAEGK